MPLPPYNPNEGKYKMTKKQLIEWMYRYGWKYGTEELVQKKVMFPDRGPHAGEIVLQKLIWVPQNFKCPNVRHGASDWVFLTLMATGVYLTCIHRNCRMTMGPLNDKLATKKARSKIITLEEAMEIESEQHQFGLSRDIGKYAEAHGLFID